MKKVIDSSQDGIMKRKSYLANTAAFYDSITCSGDKVRRADIIVILARLLALSLITFS